MRTILLSLALLFSAKGFSQSNNLTDLSWYRMLTGKIGKYPITMHLHKEGSRYEGFYYYSYTQKPVYFSGDDTMYDGRIVVGCYLGESLTETFDFTFYGDSAVGTWMQNEIDKKLAFATAITKMPVDFTYVFTEGSKELIPEMDESPQATFEASSVWPVGTSASDEFVKQAIRDFQDKNNKRTEDVGLLLIWQKKKFFENYLEDNKEVEKEDFEEYSFSYNQDVIDRLMVQYQNQNLITLASTGYYYSGGAHGLYGTSYMLLDLRNNRKLDSLDDVFTQSGKQKLSQLLEKTYRQQYNIKPSESLEDAGLFVNKIEPNDNFYLTGKGVGFTYNPYEIGSYAMGEIELFIPFSALGDGLRPEIKALLD